jgi:hypothetical protein
VSVLATSRLKGLETVPELQTLNFCGLLVPNPAPFTLSNGSQDEGLLLQVLALPLPLSIPGLPSPDFLSPVFTSSSQRDTRFEPDLKGPTAHAGEG